MCGEYGEAFSRPHFHACLFGVDFADKVEFSCARNIRAYVSPLLSKLWPLGFSLIGDVNFQSAAYCARYVMGKVTGHASRAHYLVTDVDSGEVVSRVPEFSHMSLKPGIGSKWLDKYHSDVYPDGLVVMNGVKCRPPKYYDRKLKRSDPDVWDSLVFARDVRARARYSDNTDARLLVKEQVVSAQVGFLKRTI